MWIWVRFFPQHSGKEPVRISGTGFYGPDDRQCQNHWRKPNALTPSMEGKLSLALSFLNLLVGLLMVETLILLCRLFDANTLSSTEWAKNCTFLPRDAMLARYMLRPCVRPSVCLSQVGVLPKQLITETWRCTTAKDLREISMGWPPTEAPTTGG